MRPVATICLVPIMRHLNVVDSGTAMPLDIHQLKKHLRCLEQNQSPDQTTRHTRVSSGCRSLDGLLPGRGFARGSLVEWLAGNEGSGVSGLALTTAREACRDGGVLVLIDRSRTLYPPGVAAWRIDLQRTILVRPENENG